jgi:Co/Zn/Cd efflux system component
VSHSHDHGHGHVHLNEVSASQVYRLKWALALTAGFLIAEVVGALLSNSLALLADAGHMLTDAGALALSLFVAWFSRQPSSPRHTYGYLRWEILAAFLNDAAARVGVDSLGGRGPFPHARAARGRRDAGGRGAGPGGQPRRRMAAAPVG